MDWDIVNDKLTWDDHMYHLYGITPSTFSGAYDAWENGLHPDDKEAGNQSIENAIAGEKEFDTEFRVVWPDKSIHFIKANSLVQRDTSGKAVRMVGTNWDITERKQQLEIIQQNEEKFRALLEAAPDAMLIVNSEGKIELINQQTIKFFDYTASELIGSPIEILIPDRHKTNHPHQRNNFSANPRARGMGEGLELFAKKKNGEEIPVEISLSPLHTAAGILIIASIRDITNRKKAEQLNKEQEETIRLFVKHTPAAVAMFDTDIKYIIASDRWYKDYGLQGKEIIGKSHYDIFPEIRNMPAWMEIHQRCLKGATEINDESPFPRPDGQTDWLHWEIHPWKKHDGSIGGIIMFTEVITEKVKAKGLLNKLNAELAASNSELEQFAYVASHDLQEPLRMVSSFLQLLEKKYKPNLDETASKYIHFAVDGADRMKVLINDLLAFSKIGSVSQEMGLVDTALILEDTKSVLRTAIQDSGAIIHSGLLPVIKGDSMQIKQIFQNLIGNAIKYSGTEKPVIEISSGETENHWLFTIKDNGIGFDPKYAEKIFVLFQRLHTKKEFSGTGIGLAICKKIAEKHGGKIWVESAEGKGSSFYFSISRNTQHLL